MEMQDNEFDELFRSKLDGFEAEPSAKVWPGIIAGLNGSNRKIFGPFLSIAASITILVAAGILFIPQKENLPVKHNVKSKTAKNPLLLGSPWIIKNRAASIVLNLQRNGKSNEAVAGKTSGQHASKATEPVQALKNPIEETVQQVNNDNQSSLASIQQKQPDTIKAVVPDKETQLAIKLPMEETASFITKPAFSGVQLPASNKRDTAAVKTIHKIRGIRDLINAVVAKIDKRKDKIIEFNNADDDGLTLTGVNLGIIKIKKGK